MTNIFSLTFFLSSLFYRPSNSSQMRMSTTDLRAGGISGPTGFVHVSGYGRAYQPGRCSSISGTPMMSPPRESRGRARELSNIDPKFTSQVRPKYKDSKYSLKKDLLMLCRLQKKLRWRQYYNCRAISQKKVILNALGVLSSKVIFKALSMINSLKVIFLTKYHTKLKQYLIWYYFSNWCKKYWNKISCFWM